MILIQKALNLQMVNIQITIMQGDSNKDSNNRLQRTWTCAVGAED